MRRCSREWTWKTLLRLSTTPHWNWWVHDFHFHPTKLKNSFKWWVLFDWNSKTYLFFIFQTSFAGSSRSRLLPLGQWHFFKVFLEFIFTWRLQNQLFGCCFRFISSSQVVGLLGYGQSGLQGLLAWTRLGIIFIQINLIWIDVNSLFWNWKTKSCIIYEESEKCSYQVSGWSFWHIFPRKWFQCHARR